MTKFFNELQATLYGNLTRDPRFNEIETTNGPVSVANFTLAISRGRDVTPMWAEVALWGKSARAFCDYVRKGDQVIIPNAQLIAAEDGNPHTYEYNDEVRAKFQFHARNFVFGKQAGGGGGDYPEDDEDPVDNALDQL